VAINKYRTSEVSHVANAGADGTAMSTLDEWAVTLGSGVTFTKETLNGIAAAYMNDTSAINTGNGRLTLPRPPPDNVGDRLISFEFKFNIPSNSTIGIAFYQSSTIKLSIQLISSTGVIQTNNGASFVQVGSGLFENNDTVTVEVVLVSTTKHYFYVTVDGIRTLYNNSGSYYDNFATWTGQFTRFDVNTTGGGTDKVYIWDFFTKEQSDGFRWETFESRGTVLSRTMSSSYPPAYVGGTGGQRNILIPQSTLNQVRRAQLTTDWVSWSGLISTVYSIILGDFAGVVYSSSVTTGTLHQFSKSTDYGGTFTAKAGTGINDGTCHGMFLNPAGGSNPLYLVSRRNANNNIDIWRYDDSLNSWSITATQAVTTGSSYNNQCWGFTFKEGATNLYLFLADDNDVAQIIEFNTAAGTILKRGNPITINGTSYHCAGDSYPLFYSTPNVSSGIIYATVINNSTGDFTLVKSDASLGAGNTWEVVAVDVKYRFIYQEYIDRTQTDIIDWIRDVENAEVGEWDGNIETFLQRKFIGDGEAYLVEVNASFKNHVLFDQDGSDVDVYTWEILNARDTFKRTTMIQSGTQDKYTFQGSVSPSTRATFTNGDIVDFYDGFGILALRAKFVESRNPDERSRYIMNFEGFNADFKRNKHKELFSSKTTKQIMQSVIDDDTYTYRDNSIDPNNDFITQVTRLVQDLRSNVALYSREMENALFYMEPDGKVWNIKKTRATATGFTWNENSRGIRLMSYNDPDLGRTRSEVTGVWNQGTSDNQQIRRVYIGDADAERKGIVAIEKSDNQLRNDTECLQMATNRYNMYGNQIQVVKLRVEDFGFIQPGETIQFSWNDNRENITLGTFYIMKWEWDCLTDINMIWLVDNIVTEDEYRAVQTTFKEDDDIKSTFQDQTVESTTDGTVITLNPVGRLQAGASVWRIPEPSAADFVKGDLTNDTTWNDLDLSSIIPEGTRVVRLSIKYQTPFVGDNILFRKKGQANAIQVDGLYSQIANKPDLRSVEVGVNESRVCQIKVDRAPSSWSQIDITVLKDEL
jgi:hypothetical protein